MDQERDGFKVLAGGLSILAGGVVTIAAAIRFQGSQLLISNESLYLAIAFGLIAFGVVIVVKAGRKV